MPSNIVKWVAIRSILDRTRIHISVRRAFIVTVTVCVCLFVVGQDKQRGNELHYCLFR